MKKIRFIVANLGFQDEEFSIPFKILKGQGYECYIASGEGGSCKVFFQKP